MTFDQAFDAIPNPIRIQIENDIFIENFEINLFSWANMAIKKIINLR